MSRTLYTVVFVVAGLAWAGAALADKIVLKNGEELSGRVMGSAGGYTIVRLHTGEQKRFRSKDIVKVVEVAEEEEEKREEKQEVAGPALATSRGGPGKATGPQAALERRIAGITFAEMPLEDILNFIERLPVCKDLDLVLDKQNVRNGKVVVTLQGKDMLLREALTSMLKPKGLDFAIRDNAILISTQQRIAELKREAQARETGGE